MMSVHHSRSEASATNRRCTKSSCGAGSGRPRRCLRRCTAPASPSTRISRATRLRPQRTPRPPPAAFRSRDIGLDALSSLVLLAPLVYMDFAPELTWDHVNYR
ncbi:MAG TPA: hypothetical protein VNA20_00055 [Frankiaceae bacterium]|nr:hypothetical protein [Frankiaceae bacterium]